MELTCVKCGSKEYNDNNVCTGCGYFINQILKGTLLMKRYEILKAIKAGGMGAIYLAYDIYNDKKYALKQMFIYEEDEEMRKQTVRRFLQEARLLAELSYPSIPKVIDYFNEKNHNYYMIMDFIEGTDLYTCVKNKGEGFSEKEVLKFGIEVCDILDYLHSRPQPVVHRDINPTNLILRKGDQKLILVDFGFARPVNPERLNEIKSAVGTECYSAPEQTMGFPEPGSDIFSLGATMYFLLSGQNRAPLRPVSLTKLRPDISQQTVAIIEKAMKLHIKSRYSSALEMGELLSETLSFHIS